MNAPTLNDLHKQRAALLKQEAELWRTREGIARAERAAEKAERDLLNSRPVASSSIENWMSQGANGEFPGVDSLKLAHLQEAAARARDVLRLSAGARAMLADLAAVIAQELEDNRIAIESHGGNLREAS